MMTGELSFQYPWFLLLLVLIPLAALWVLIRQRRFWRDAFAFSHVSVLKSLRKQPRQVLVQRIGPLLLLLSMGACLVGLAQPVLKTTVVTQNTYLMLVMDISISMEATDLSPNRLEATKRAAIDFTRDLPDGVRLGLEFFAGNSFLITPPIENHRLITSYLSSLKKEDLRQGTAIGDALMVALDSLNMAINRSPEHPSGGDLSDQPQGAIILMTDGENNLGIAPSVAIENAKKQRVNVFTVGMGEESGAYVRGGIFTHLDEPTLRAIASETGGTYYRARSFEDFKSIYREIGRKTLGYEEKSLSLMPICLGLALMGMLGTLVWGVQYRRFF